MIPLDLLMKNKPRRTHQLLLVAMGIAALFALTGAGGCKRLTGQAAADKKKADHEPVPVQVLRLAPASITRVLRYDADVAGELEIKIFSQVPERIVSLPVEEGDRVRKGQVLAVVRAETLNDTVRSSLAALEAARAEREYLRQEVGRQGKLLQRKIVAESTLDQLKSKLAAAEAQIRRLEALSDQASTQKGNAVIRSPIEGYVGQRHLSQGDMAAPTLPILTVVQMERVELVLEAPEQDLALIREKMKARVEVARFPGRTFEGTVELISPTIDRRTRTARVKVVLGNLDHALMPGMLAIVRLEVERHDNVVVVPYDSLVLELEASGETTYHAYVVKGGQAEPRAIGLGIIDSKRVEITSGLAAGDLLVSKGQHLLEAGRPVTVVERIEASGQTFKVSQAEDSKSPKPSAAAAPSESGGERQP